MREAVLHLSGYNYRSVYGINYRVKEKITMADLAFRVQAVIKTEVDVTEAQLSRIRTLQEAGYLSVTKSFQNNRSLTTCSLTRAGRQAFANYINLLEQIVRESKSNEP